ncbi:MAG: hypothetical protein AAGD11_01795 [Planctomycetota bacterium]
MRPIGQLSYTVLFGVLTFGLVAPSSASAEPDAALIEQVDTLVRQLNADAATQRDEAEAALLKHAPIADAEKCDDFLQLLPTPSDGMPAEVRLRLARLRKRIETEQSSRALAASKLTLDAEGTPLAEVFDLIREQTGNRLSDYREQFGQTAASRKVTIEVTEEEFWPAVDKILDQAGVTTYPFSGEDTLAIVNRDEGALPRAEGAAYAGPFRIQAVNVSARRNLRSASEQSARVELEIAWEPRLRPIALSQSITALQVTTDEGTSLPVASQRQTLNVEVQPGSHATEFTVPLQLPDRSATKIASFAGQMSALVPGRTVDFKFAELDKPKSFTQSRGGVQVTLVGARKNQDLWEIHMRIKVDSAEAGLESHRGWVFQNLTYLLNPQGELIDHAGFETTMQSQNEVGLAYFFEVIGDNLRGYTWVYRSPAAIVRLPVEFELKDIPLP